MKPEQRTHSRRPEDEAQNFNPLVHKIFQMA